MHRALDGLKISPTNRSSSHHPGRAIIIPQSEFVLGSDRNSDQGGRNAQDATHSRNMQTAELRLGEVSLSAQPCIVFLGEDGELHKAALRVSRETSAFRWRM